MVALVSAGLTSALLLLLRLDMARVVGLGDREALYLAYGLHPRAGYLNQPGLIGWIASVIGVAVEPRAVHVLCALASTALPWVGVLAARACGASSSQATRAYFPLALLPALSIGSAAFVPDLPFAFCWLLTLGCAGWALRHPPTHFGTLLACLGTGVFAGLGCLSMTSGWLLALALSAVALGKPRDRLRTLAPWAGLGVFAILVSPLVGWWLVHGVNLHFERHSDTLETVLGLSRPLLFATPPFLYAGYLVTRDLLAPARTAPIDRLLRLTLLIPLLPMALLAAFGTTEVDWLAPAYLTLSVHFARAAPVRVTLLKSCLAVGWGIALLGWCWLRTELPVVTGQLLGGYEPSQDTSNDFYAWGPGRQLVDEAVEAVHERTGQVPIVVGPHWAVCAQAEVALGGQVHVGCDSLELDDYDSWSNPDAWSNAQTILFVTDSRFHDVPPATFYGRTASAVHSTLVERFGRGVRRIDVVEFERNEENAQALGACTDSPARSSNARSSAASGLGVVKSLSP